MNFCPDLSLENPEFAEPVPSHLPSLAPHCLHESGMSSLAGRSNFLELECVEVIVVVVVALI